MSASARRLLVVKLADLGDALTITPALQALGADRTWERVDLLVSPHCAPLFAGWARGEVVTLDKRRWDRPGGGLGPASLGELVRLGRALRRRGYAAVALMHHLSTAFGRLKYAALLSVVGAPIRAGLRPPHSRMGALLNRPVLDEGFGVHSEVEYALAVARELGASYAQPPPYRSWLPDASPRAERLLEEIGLEGRAGTLVALHPGVGSFAPARRWPPAAWASLAGTLRADGLEPFWVGGPEERPLVASLQGLMGAPLPDAAGRTDLACFGAVLSRCGALVSADGGPVHLAVAAGCPVVALYGPTDPAAWQPSARKLVAIASPAHCGPCLYQPGRHPGQVNCPPGVHGEARPFCMELIAPGSVAQAVRGLLE